MVREAGTGRIKWARGRFGSKGRFAKKRRAWGATKTMEGKEEKEDAVETERGGRGQHR